MDLLNKGEGKGKCMTGPFFTVADEEFCILRRYFFACQCVVVEERVS